MNIVPVKTNALEAPASDALTPSVRSAAQGADAFAFRLSAELSKSAGSGNFVCSPFSVWLPLAALSNATDEKDKAALLTALGADGAGAEDLNAAAEAMMYSLTNLKGSPVKIANSIFVADYLVLNKDFAQAYMDYYRGSSINIDFTSPNAVDDVNKWASDNSGGLIPSIVDSFDPLTIAAILNAVYFADTWTIPVNPNVTYQDVFHSPSGDTRAHYMRMGNEVRKYYENDDLQAAALSFASGVEMCVILPKNESANDLLLSMTNDYFNKIINGAAHMDGSLELPRFTFDSGSMELKDALIGLGVPLFDESLGPLTGLTTDVLPEYLGGASQKAYIQVDEEGAKAAAVTIATDAPAATDQPVTFNMFCDKPFVFVLYDSTPVGTQVLFTGIVNQPE